MALAPFFDRIYGAVGPHLSVSRETLIAALQSKVVGISCGPDLSTNDTTIADLTVNIVARLYPQIAINGKADVRDRLAAAAIAINPNIEVIESLDGATTIAVGREGPQGAIYPSASGWVAHVGHAEHSISDIENPYSSGAAAALASAELFRRVLLHGEPEPDSSLSLLDFGNSTGADRPLSGGSIGDVLVLGVGAIGNAAIWAMSRDPNTEGTLILLDHEQLSLSNLQRYVLATYGDVGTLKVDIAARALQASRFSVSSHAIRVENFAPPTDYAQPPTTCVSVDNIEGRRVAQALLPKLVINGWTGDRALGCSWHEFDRNAACLACLYQPTEPGPSATQQAAKALGLSEERATVLWVTRAPLSEDERKVAAKTLGVKISALKPWKNKPLPDLYTDVVCGAVPLDLAGTGQVEVVPLAHQSVLAGVLTAAELLKRTNPDLAGVSQSETLVAWDDVLRAPPKLWRKPRPREKGCICSDPAYQAIYHSKWRA
jgi:hypothetical protein